MHGRRIVLPVSRFQKPLGDGERLQVQFDEVVIVYDCRPSQAGSNGRRVLAVAADFSAELRGARDVAL